MSFSRLLESPRLRRVGAWIAGPVTSWIGHRGSSSAAAIAFYTAFSLAPTLVIVIAVASMFYGADAIQGRLFDQIRGVVGNEAAASIQAMVANARHADVATGTTLLSLFAVLIGASATFSSLNTALNLIWPVPAPLAPHAEPALAREGPARLVWPRDRRGLPGRRPAGARHGGQYSWPMGLGRDERLV
ncbi:MAG: YhjD/YihY/BrkB family envelope integrity protein [Pararobbsia sp.]